jgi:hypothetical protein
VKLAERARREGLDAAPEIRVRVRWARARTLATLEITRRINQVLLPPTAAEMRSHFEANLARYEQPPEMDLSILELAMPRGSPRQALDEALGLAQELRSGERAFDEAARARSLHGSAQGGGRVGWQSARQVAPLGPNVLRALRVAAPGQVVGPVQQDDSLWIVKLWARRPARPLTFEEAKVRVEQELGNARVAELQERVEAEARKALNLRLQPRPASTAP